MSVEYKGKAYYVTIKKNILSLDLHSKNISNITEIKGLNNLAIHQLNLSNNLITEINGLERLSKLQSLNLSGNNITEIKNIDKMTNLQILDLSKNQISEIKGLGNLKNLTSLNLDNNPVFKRVKENFGKGGIKNPQVLVEFCAKRDKIRREEISDIQKIRTETTIKKNIFLSYSTKDSEYFNIPNIAKELEMYPDIEKAFYWEADSGQDIIDYMEDNLGKCKTFVLFCSQNAKYSKSVKAEWKSAFQLKQAEKLKIVPVFENLDDIPNLLRPLLGVKFNKSKFDAFIKELYEEILRD